MCLKMFAICDIQKLLILPYMQQLTLTHIHVSLSSALILYTYTCRECMVGRTIAHYQHSFDMHVVSEQ